tara:strand:- start:1169 stop:1900 length:732 start_codon:yes stop_codon:yes gene_type:complete
MKILVSGHKGVLAKALAKASHHELFGKLEVICVSKNELDITLPGLIEKAINKYKPDVFLHVGAIAGSMKQHEESPLKSIEVNIIGTANVANVCGRRGVKVVYISTDYVYCGIKGNNTEESPTKPFNNYGLSKLGGECAVRMLKDSLILRCSFTERPFKHDKAFYDSQRSYLYDDMAATSILKCIEAGVTGIVNVGGLSQSVYSFAQSGNPKLASTTRLSVNEFVPLDTSMCVRKLQLIIKPID